MKILVLNAGSSSLKYSVYEGKDLLLQAKGVVEKIGDTGGSIRHKFRTGQSFKEIERKENIADHFQALHSISIILKDLEHGVIKNDLEIKFVGHRVVHGGEYFNEPCLVDEDLKKKVKELIPLAPLHNPHNLLGIQISEELFPKAKHIAVFDTAFHQTIPDYAYRYAIPQKLYNDYGIRVYGMHGTSHSYITSASASYLKKDREQLNLITIHLGNGCSVSAIQSGKCIDTSLGFSPLPGLVMGTRSGDIDPSIIFHLIRQHTYTYQEVESILNKESGLKGLTGYTDLRDINRLREDGNEDAKLALEVYCYRIKKYISAYHGIIGKVDAIVFTAGVGENDAFVRHQSVNGLEHIGIAIDTEKNNQKSDGIRELQSVESKTKILVVPTDEEKQIALAALRFI